MSSTIASHDRPRSWSQIDLAITRLQALHNLTELTLESSLNVFSPISMLNTDVLTAIFNEVALSDEPPDSHILIPVAQVCQRWREILSNRPSLWSFFDLTRKRSHPAVLSRSFSAPITLDFSPLDDVAPSPPMRQFMSTNAYRIKTLIVNTQEPGPGSEDWADDDDEPFIQLLPKLSDNYAPLLRNLTLSGIDVDWHWPVFSQLTDLCVHTSTQGLLTALRNMPSLRHLDIVCPIPRSSRTYTGGPPSADIIKLPFLRTLKVQNPVLQDCVYFVNHLVFPASAQVVLRINNPSDGRDPLVPRPPSQLCTGSNRRLEVHTSTNELHFSQLNTKLEIGDITRMRSACIKSYFVAALYAFGQTTDLEHLDIKSSEHDLSMMATDWAGLLRPMTQLNHVGVTLSASGRALLSALIELQMSTGGVMDAVLLPGLQELVVGIEEDRHQGQEEEKCLGIMQYVLHVRHEMGAKISRVKVIAEGKESSRMIRERIDELKSSVDVFEWEVGTVSVPYEPAKKSASKWRRKVVNNRNSFVY